MLLLRVRLVRTFLFLVLFLPQLALAQRVQGEGVSAVTPSGWVQLEASRMAELTFQPRTQTDVFFEIRKSTLSRTDFASSYSDAFHTSLKHSGFQQVDRGAQLMLPLMGGMQTEYRALGDESMYRLLVVEILIDETVWLICAFFDERRRESYLKVFARFVSELSFEPTEE